MLTIDIGNSAIKWGIWQDGQLVLAETAVYDRTNLGKSLDDVFFGAPRQVEVWVACVAGAEIEQVLSDWMKQQWAVETVYLHTVTEQCGVKNMYPDPSQHGVDRWAALLGARQLYQVPVCIIDVGTAVTVDLMDEEGIHRGGRIMPGLDMMRTSLLEHTEEINDIDGECPGFAINTADAVSSGTLHMLLAGLIEVCESARQRLGDDMEIIMTGGMAETMLPLLDLPDIHHEPHLILHGLFYASEQ
jgi:type III pantothenate kinase